MTADDLNPLPPTPADGDSRGEAFFAGESSILFAQAMRQTRMSVTLADPHQPDCPIVFCNRAFEELTGYARNEIIGRNCRFLQGPDTAPEAVDRIRAAVATRDVALVEILNYRRDGTAFWNSLHVGPIYDDAGRLRYFFGSQWDVTDVHAARADGLHARLMEREISHRMKNMFSVISAMVSMLGRQSPENRRMAEQINSRIFALGRAHEATLGTLLHSGPIQPDELFAEVVSPYAPGGRQALTLDGPSIRIDAASVSVLALTLNELATNAVKHGALADDAGTISIRWRNEKNDAGEPAIRIDWEEFGGPAVTEPSEEQGTGFGILTRMLQVSGGRMETDWRTEGLHVILELPETGRSG